MKSPWFDPEAFFCEPIINFVNDLNCIAQNNIPQISANERSYRIISQALLAQSHDTPYAHLIRNFLDLYNEFASGAKNFVPLIMNMKKKYQALMVQKALDSILTITPSAPITLSTSNDNRSAAEAAAAAVEIHSAPLHTACLFAPEPQPRGIEEPLATGSSGVQPPSPKM